MSSESEDPQYDGPEYSKCTLDQLRDVHAHINRDAHPERFARVVAEIQKWEQEQEQKSQDLAPADGKTEAVSGLDDHPQTAAGAVDGPPDHETATTIRSNDSPRRPVARILWVLLGGIVLVAITALFDKLLALQIGGAVLPGLLWLIAVYSQDKYEPEPIREIILIYVWGAGMTIPALWINSFNDIILSSIFPDGEGARLAVSILAGPVEESLKLLAVLSFLDRHPDFDEPLDGMIYASTAALGFASAENIGYVMEYGRDTAIVRALFTIPGHFLFAGFYGFAIGKRLGRSLGRRGILFGWLLASIFHGAGNASIRLRHDPQYSYMGWVTLGLLVVLAITYRSMVRKLMAISPFRPTVSHRLEYCPECHQILDGVPLKCGHCGSLIPVPVNEVKRLEQ